MTTPTSEFQMIPLAEIHESKHNPRKHFDGPALAQLADSIRKVGVLTPCIVRPNAKGFELAAGHRRYRASKVAGLEQLPCRVRQMTDQEFLEVLTIENLQREDVHPLDEAAGYEALMAAPYKMPVEKIAERVGKSVKYIYDRVKLLALCKEGRDLFWSGLIEAGHAILLARLSPAEQAKVIGDKDDDYQNGGLLALEHRLFDTEDEEEAAYSQGRPVKAKSVREVEAYIKQHIRFNARQADAFLFPDTVLHVSAATTTKRKIIEITHDYLATDDVRQAGKDRIYGERAWKRADGLEESKACDRSVLGVIVCGPGQGQAFDVCVNKDKCTVHWGTEIKAREKCRKDLAKGGTAAVSAKASLIKEEQKRKAEDARRDAERKQWKQATPAILKAVAERVKKLPVKASGFLAGLVLDQLNESWTKPVKKAGQYLGLGTSAEDALRFAAYVCLVKVVCSSYRANEDFAKLAKPLGIDLAKLLSLAAQQSEVEQENRAGVKRGKAIEKRQAKKRRAA